MVWILFLFWFIVFAFLIWKLPFFRKSGLTRRFVLSAFALKILAGTALTLIYTYYYTDKSNSDIWKYYDDAEVIYGSLKHNPVHYFELVSGINEDAEHLQPYYREMKNWSPQSEQWLKFTQTKNFNFFNSNRFVTRFNALVRPLSGGNIFTNIIFFCFFSLFGLTAFYRQVRPFIKGKELLAVFCIFLLPSTLLWCSGVLKDGFILCFINVLIYQLFPPAAIATAAPPLKLQPARGKATGVTQTAHTVYSPAASANAIRSVFARVFVVLLLSWVIVLSKYYVLIALIPGLIAFLILKARKIKRPFISYSAVVIVLVLCSILLSVAAPKYSGWAVLAEKREESLKSAIFADANNLLFIDKTESDWYSVLSRIPESLINAVCRPFINEAGNSPVLMLTAAENLLITLLLLWIIIHSFKGISKSEPACFFFFFSILLAFIIGFTTPVAGGIVRYKTAFIPYLLLAGIIVTNLHVRVPGQKKLEKLIIQ